MILSWFVLAAMFLTNLVSSVIHNPHLWSDAEQKRVLGDTELSVAFSYVMHENQRLLFLASHLDNSVRRTPYGRPKLKNGKIEFPPGFPPNIIWEFENRDKDGSIKA